MTDQELDAFQKGYLVGKAEVYCEQARTGAKLVGAFGFDRRYIGLVKRTVKTEGCKLVIEPVLFTRARNGIRIPIRLCKASSEDLTQLLRRVG